MGFNRRKMEDERRGIADKEAAARRATDAQVLEDAKRLIDAWNERQSNRMPMLFSPTIGAAIAARHWWLQNEWETVQASRDRDAIYQYLTAVFELVMWWAMEGKAVKRANRALPLRGYNSEREPEPFAAVILCTADRLKVDDRTRSKWSRVLRYAAEYKGLDEPLRSFIKRKSGINKCAARFARRLRIF